MNIDKIKIHNWRSIPDIEIDFEDFMIFIGQNNSGKSNIISSLLFFFGNISHNDLDFHDNTTELFIEVTFTNLDDFDKNQFKKYLSADNKICVRKSAEKGGDVTYYGYLFSPQEDFLKEKSTSDKREDLEKTPLVDFLPKSGRLTKDIVRTAQEDYIKANKDSIQLDYELESTNFLGAKSVAKGIFGDVYFIPAVKSATDEFKTTGTTIFNQLFTQIISKMSEQNEHYKNARSQMLALTQILNKVNADGDENIDRPIEIKSLEQNLEEELKKWNTTIDIEITPPNIDDVLKVNTNIWVDDGKRTDIGRKGHGLQRSLIFALIKSWANYLKADRLAKAEEQNEEDKPKRKSSNSTYFLFEEPELFLHPQAQRELYNSLSVLAEANNQVVLCTHSSSFLDLEDYKSICIVSKESNKTTIKQFTAELFTSDEKTNFNLVYWLNPERSELFFASKVILVEGATDKTMIPILAQKIGEYKFQYSVVECGGKDSIKLYIKLLNCFKLPYVAVYDRDHQNYKDQNAKNSADTSSKNIEDEIDSTIGKSIILINDIEEEIGIVGKQDKNKPFVALQEVSSETFNLSDSLKEKIKKIYE
ncbi:MAG: AAA family ATPase [Ignavibacteria bacterium]|nr:AAA family ATPase [Ignavibacteria bacterium]